MDTKQTSVTPLEATAIEDAEERILADLIGAMGAVASEELTEGGSPARLVRVALPEGPDQVVKLLVDLPGAVDGHDLESFRVKIRQIEKVRRDVPALGEVYTELSSEHYGNDWAAYTMPFYPNRDIAAPLRQGEAPGERYETELKAILTDLIGHGYLSERTPAVPGQIADIHGDRLSRRFWLLRQYLPPELAEADRITVNGIECRNPLELARRVMEDPALTAGIDPVDLFHPVHGDLNTRNILVTDGGRLAAGDGGYRIIDPRGTLDPWDPAYDLAKILFSFTVWDPGLRKGFDMESSEQDGWTVAIRGGNYPSYLAAAHGLLPLMRSLEPFREMTAGDPGWESRYLLGHAFHLLGEAACRLSDIKKRTNEDDDAALSPIDLAQGHYLYGVLFLEDAVRQLEANGAIDHDTTLSLLD